MTDQYDPYTILRLRPGSSDGEIKRQYRRLAKIYHPDRNPGEEEWCGEQLKEIGEALAVLSDPARKQAIDARLRAARGSGAAGAARPNTGASRSGAGAAYQNSYSRPKPPDAASVAPSPGVDVNWTPHVRPPAAKTITGPFTALAVILIVLALAVVYRSLRPPARKPAVVAASVSVHPRHAAVSTMTASLPRTRHRRRLVARTAAAPMPEHRAAPRPAHNLTSSEKDAIALRSAEAAEARGRAVEERRLRHMGVATSGLNYSEMRKVDEIASHPN